MTERQIDYAMKKLVDAGLIIKGNYNKSAYDRTCWYAITKAGYSILQNCEMGETNLSNGNDAIVEPIPDNKPDSKPDSSFNKQKERKKNKKEEQEEFEKQEELLTVEKIKKIPDKEISEKILAVFKNKKIKGKPITKEALKVIVDRLNRFSGSDRPTMIEILDTAIAKGYDDVFEPFKKQNKSNYQSKEYSGYDLAGYEKEISENYEDYLKSFMDKL